MKFPQSDNGNEFTAAVVTDELEKAWPGIRIIRGRPRHPQSQGAVERGNGHLSQMIGNLLIDIIEFSQMFLF